MCVLALDYKKILKYWEGSSCFLNLESIKIGIWFNQGNEFMTMVCYAVSIVRQARTLARREPRQLSHLGDVAGKDAPESWTCYFRMIIPYLKHDKSPLLTSVKSPLHHILIGKWGLGWVDCSQN